MIEVAITPYMIAEAEQRANDMGILRNSLLNGKGNFTGFLGEAIISHYFSVPYANTYDYDLILNNYKVDVKSRSGDNPPHDKYDFTILDINTTQQCDYYAFVYHLKDLSKAWIMGFVKKNTFYKYADYQQAGTFKPDSNLTYEKDNYVWQADCIRLTKNPLNDLLYQR